MSVDLGLPGRRVDRSTVGEATRLALSTALQQRMRGQVSFDSGTRAAYATDSSNYRQVPLGVVFPVDADDVAAALEICGEHDAAVLGRGGGTALAGQTCNVGVIFDMSRHMNQILEIDPERRIARVQPGVVLDNLRDAAETYGLTFGPDPATHAWCTIGGMIGNNSCGTHALYAGKTVDNVARLQIITYDGERLDVGPTDNEELQSIIAGGGRRGEIYAGLVEIRDRYGDLVRERYPDIPRRVSGYNLDELLPDKSFDVARALVGTESTCVLVTEATLHLVTSPQHRRLVVLGYPDIFIAADNVPGVLEFSPLGLEAIDDTLVRQMVRSKLNLEALPLLPDGSGWLFVEVGSDDPGEADELAARLAKHAPGSPTVRSYADPADQKNVWVIRESGLGATAMPPGEPMNHEGWEDAAVPPERLGEYLRKLTALWREYGYSGALYGHAGQGCMHNRNNFDFATAEGLRNFREFIERAADLVSSLGGSISGEHGDGQGRGELLERVYGAELVDGLRAFKSLWDPRGRMNPGKVVDAFPLDTNLRHGPDHHHSDLGPTAFSFPDDDGVMAAAVGRCVGVGRCRRDDTGVMCPSYRATRDELHSTRGRAKLFEEMFRGDVTESSWRNEDVRQALDLCLSCKGCKLDCPTHVDMATYKSEFMSHYYKRRLRPRVDYALGLLPWVSRLATRMPRLANLVARNTTVRQLGGVTTDRPPPRFARKSLRRWAKRRSPARTPDVVLWPDSFTDAFTPDAGRAAVLALEKLGSQVAVPTSWACCGRTLYDSGMLDLARRSLRRVLDVLEPYGDVPVVVPEPSCLAAFRDELPALLPEDPRARSLARRAVSLAEHLVASGAELPTHPAAGARAMVQPHCQGRSVGATSADAKVLAALGFEVQVLDEGCCGLAGSFGYNAEHAELAKQIGEISVLPAVRDAPPATIIVADGFSCATQIGQLAPRETRHLAELIAEAFIAS